MRKTERLFSKLIPTLTILITASCVYAQDLVSARILAAEGPVEIRRRSNAQPQIQKIAFKPNDEIYAGDAISTGRGGRLTLALSDGSQAIIAPQSTVVVENLTLTPRVLFRVLRGKARVHIEKLGGRPNPYRVNTPTAVIAVRGTIFDVIVDGSETEVYLHEGSVAIHNLASPDRIVLLAAGQMTKVFETRPPNNPNIFKIGRNDDVFRKPTVEKDNRRIAERMGSSPGDSGGGLRPPGGPASGPDRGSGPRPDVGSGDKSPNQSRSRPNGSGGPGGAGGPGGPGGPGGRKP
jgi:hypothetical protein